MRRIIAAFERQSSCEKLQRLVESSGEYSCVICRNGAQAHRFLQKKSMDAGLKLARTAKAVLESL